MRLPPLLCAVLLVGCPSKAPPSAESPAPTVEPDPPAPSVESEPSPPADPLGGPADLQPGGLEPPPGMEVGECIDACMKSSMAEARSPEAIRADCEASCGAGEPLPITRAGDLALHLGKRVQAEGVVVAAKYPTLGTTGWAVALGAADGPLLWVSTDGAPAGWTTIQAGHTVRIEGTLEQGPTGNGERIRIPFLGKPGEPVRIGEPE